MEGRRGSGRGRRGLEGGEIVSPFFYFAWLGFLSFFLSVCLFLESASWIGFSRESKECKTATNTDSYLLFFLLSFFLPPILLSGLTNIISTLSTLSPHFKLSTILHENDDRNYVPIPIQSGPPPPPPLTLPSIAVAVGAVVPNRTRSNPKGRKKVQVQVQKTQTSPARIPHQKKLAGTTSTSTSARGGKLIRQVLELGIAEVERDREGGESGVGMKVGELQGEVSVGLSVGNEEEKVGMTRREEREESSSELVVRIVDDGGSEFEGEEIGETSLGKARGKGKEKEKEKVQVRKRGRALAARSKLKTRTPREMETSESESWEGGELFGILILLAFLQFW